MMYNRKAIYAAAILMITAVVAIGCEQDDIAGPACDIPADFVGDFDAARVEFTSVANDTTIDVVAEGGSFDLDIEPDCEFTSTFVTLAGEDITRTGTVAVEGGQITFTTDTGMGVFRNTEVQPAVFEITATSEGIVLVNTTSQTFDFGEGPEAAELEIGLIRT